jgi:hypothetical protein
VSARYSSPTSSIVHARTVFFSLSLFLEETKAKIFSKFGIEHNIPAIFAVKRLFVWNYNLFRLYNPINNILFVELYNLDRL